jgi:hypothetical protein
VKFKANLLTGGNCEKIVRFSRVLGSILVLVFIAGLFRASSSMHESLLFGRYSASYAGLLLALLVTGLLGLTAARWLPVSKIKDHSTVKPEKDIHFGTLIPATIYASIPVMGFTLMWVLLSNEMNYLWRFQYPILPVILMTWPLLVDALKQDIRWLAIDKLPGSVKCLAMASALLLCIGLGWNQSNRWQISYQSDGRFEVAQYLSQFADKHYTIATTEAGLLPLYSGWQAVDTWGLNDAWIAHNGGITKEYLAKVHPEVIMFHANFSPVYPKKEAGDAWGSMLMTLDTYARENGYVLAAAYGDSPVDTHYYYVRPDFPESAGIVTFIRSLDGGAYHYGSHTVDYNKLQWKKE